MRSNLKYQLFVLAVCLSNVFIGAQQEQSTQELSLDSGTIESQFEYIFRKSGNFKGTNGQPYEAVKFSSLMKLKGNVLDSLNTTYNKLKNSENTVASQADEISSLKTSLAETETNLADTNKEKDSMALFGLQMSKTNYNLLMWGIIGALLALLFLFIYKYKNSNAVTKNARFKLDELETEFEEHRRNALEREQKVRRQLQDEINKQKS
jgi:hypothetical protein